MGISFIDLTRDPKHNYLLTEALQSRYILAARYLRGCRHVFEIGSFQTPITDFLTAPVESCTVVDPLLEPYEADQLNGHPCQVRHIQGWIQDVEYEREHGTYGVVMMGLVLDFPGGNAEQAKHTFARIIRLIDNAQVTVLEFCTHYEPSINQVRYLVNNTQTSIDFQVDLDFENDEHARQFNPNMSKGYMHRRLLVLKPKLAEASSRSGLAPPMCSTNPTP
ncbi:hypothetical protein BEN30_16330 [Magnetovibrio blakemorei]|uniref:Uncharacterized protein n=2 Tax=Magnetovibrio blakemorei TaxID=28181 RepID=A0A1E5Q4K9_9PROT|nr:hypothetical protein BEN30_16330 [Magnetovibrio blakemorei]